MSGLGQKVTSPFASIMSALLAEANVPPRRDDVGFVPKAVVNGGPREMGPSRKNLSIYGTAAGTTLPFELIYDAIQPGYRAAA